MCMTSRCIFTYNQIVCLLGYSSCNQSSPWTKGLVATWWLLAVWPSRLSFPHRKSQRIVSWKGAWSTALTPALLELRIQSIRRVINFGSEVIVQNSFLSRCHSAMCKVLCLCPFLPHADRSLQLPYAHTSILKIHGNGSPSVLHNFLQKHHCLYCSFSEPLMSLKNLMWLNEGSYSVSDTDTNEGKVEQIENQLLLASFMMSSNTGYYNSWKNLQI